MKRMNDGHATADDDVFEIYDRTAAELYRYASRLTGGDRQRTQDLVQDTYVHLIQRVRDGRIDPAQVEIGWLVQSCRQRYLEQVRAQRRRRTRELRAGGLRITTKEDLLSGGEATSALASLTPEHRTALGAALRRRPPGSRHRSHTRSQRPSDRVTARPCPSRPARLGDHLTGSPVMNDHDIATTIRSATLEPAPGELDHIRQRIVDDAAGIRAADHHGRRADRSGSRAAMLVAAVTVFLAVAIGALASWRGDTEAPATPPAPTPAPTTVAPTTTAPALPAGLVGVEGTWLLAAVDGVAWTGPTVPLVRVEGGTLVGWDGCNGGSWSTPTADDLGLASTTMVLCEVAVPEIFGATTAELDGATLRLSGPSGEFDFLPLAAGIVPTLDELVGAWEIGDTTVRVSTDSALGLVIDVGTCGFAVELDGAVLTPVVGPESPASCVGPAEAGFARALADPAVQLLAVVVDDVLYLTVGADADAAPSEAYALVRAVGEVPGEVPAEPILDGVSLERGEVFGLGPDWSAETVPPDQTADDTLTRVSALLGPVGADTGWYELGLTGVSGDPQCLAGAEYRVLWWGDLSVAFRRLDGVELLWTWSVGDPRASGFGDRGEPAVADTGTATALVTEAGIAVGSTLDDLLAAYPNRLIDTGSVDADGTVLYVSSGGQWPGLTNSTIGVTVRDGAVTGYATTLSLC